MSKETMRMSRQAIGALLASVALAAVLAAPAAASPPIEEFSVSSSNSQAGGHPHPTPAIRLAEPNHPEVAKDVVLNLPEGGFGDPGAGRECRSARFFVH